MTGHRLEVADVFRAHQDQLLQRWGHALSDQQRKVLRDIGLRRTAALGTHLERCDRCSYETVAYDSCRNRHCPKCQSSARDRWLVKQAASLLPVPYVHVVFTVPEQLAPLALRNQRDFYSMLFRAASETLLEIAADPHHLGARIGILAVLHTWSQNLQLHPHLHCLVPAGGLAFDSSRWVRTRRHGFFLPVRVLSRMFRGKLLAFLKQSYRRGELCFAGKLAALSTPRAFHSLLGSLRRTEWVVYSKPPFGGPEQVLKYLARYTHRVAISNGRLLSLENGQVRFRWRDSRHNNRSSDMRLEATEFMRRFLLHVLPAGFVKIRHFGLLANRSRRQALELCRAHLRSKDQTWSLLSLSVGTPSSRAGNQEIRDELARLNPELAKVAQSGNELDFGLHYGRRVEVEYEVTFVSTTSSQVGLDSIRQSPVEPPRNASLLPSLNMAVDGNAIHGVIAVSMSRYKVWLSGVSARGFDRGRAIAHNPE